MNPTESLLVLGLAALATAIALGAVSVPAALVHSSISQAFLLVIALILFSYSPVVGIAAMALFAILMFQGSVKKTAQYSTAVKKMRIEHVTDVGAYDGSQQGRDVTHFEDSYETYQTQESPKVQEPQVPVNPQSNGMYPEAANASQEDVKLDTFFYRPGDDMGDDTFVPVGTSIDEKYASYKY